MATQKLENFLPPIQSDGLNTDKNVSLGGTLAVTGASTFTGAATFSAAPSFSGGVTKTILTKTAADTLTAAQSGSTVLFSSTTGLQLVLPAPSAGLSYDFIVTKAAASGTHGIQTSAGTVFLLGALDCIPTSGTTATFSANGTSIVQIGMNGSNTGGVVGTSFRATCISATQWAVTGTLLGTGSLATPFA